MPTEIFLARYDDCDSHSIIGVFATQVEALVATGKAWAAKCNLWGPTYREIWPEASHFSIECMTVGETYSSIDGNLPPRRPFVWPKEG
jgi:hypothetical protein